MTRSRNVAYAVRDAEIKAIDSKKYGLIIINFANPDMVGHTRLRLASKPVKWWMNAWMLF